MQSNLIKGIAIVGIVLAIAHMVVWAIVQYDPLLFLAGLGVLYLFVPLVKKLRTN